MKRNNVTNPGPSDPKQFKLVPIRASKKQFKKNISKDYYKVNNNKNYKKINQFIKTLQNVELYQCGLNNLFIFRLIPKKQSLLVEESFSELKLNIIQILLLCLDTYKNINFNLTLCANYIKPNLEKEPSYEFHFATKFNNVNSATIEIDENVQHMFDTITSTTTNFQERDSGFALTKINHLDLKVVPILPFEPALNDI